MERHEQHSGKKAKESEVEVDRLSDLPDPLIHHILSLMDTKYAVRTCVLSKKWRHHWTHIHSLILTRDGKLRRMINFTRFVRHVLLRRKPSKLCKLAFHCWGSDKRMPALAQRVFNYAESHNIEELDTGFSIIPSRFLECQTLTTLKLPGLIDGLSGFASLRTLLLDDVLLLPKDQSNDIFSGGLNLQNLCIGRCWLDLESFNISALKLVNLTISYLRYDHPLPRKKKRKLAISAPSLKSFYFKGMYPLQLSLDGCQRLEKVSIHMFHSTDCMKAKKWKQKCISDMQTMVEELSHAKSFSLSVKSSQDCEEKLIYWHGR